MIEHSDGSHLALEEACRLFCHLAIGIGRRFRPRDLDGHLPVDVRIFPKIHLAHTTASKQARQAIASKLHSLEQHASILNSIRMGEDVEYSDTISYLLWGRIEE